MSKATVRERIETLFAASSNVGASVAVSPVSDEPRVVKPINKTLVIILFGLMIIAPFFIFMRRFK